MLKPICTLLHHRGHTGEKMWDHDHKTIWFICTSCGRKVVQQLDMPMSSASTLIWIAFAFLMGANVSFWIFHETWQAILGVCMFVITLIIHNHVHNSGWMR